MVDIKFNLFEITLVTTDPQLPTATIPHNRTRIRQGAHCRAAPMCGKIDDQYSHANSQLN